MHLASRAGQPKVVDLLLSLGAKISLNIEDKSFMDIAIENRKAAVALTSVKHERSETVALYLINKVIIKHES